MNKQIDEFVRKTKNDPQGNILVTHELHSLGMHLNEDENFLSSWSS
jgi:hypothetical protein